MRLIDADALRNKIDEYMKNVYDCPIDEVADFQRAHEATDIKTVYAVEGLYEATGLLDDTPTISPDSLRPKGRWVDKWKWLYKNRLYKCSVCNETALGNDKTWFLTDFCPNCGADMREEREE